MNIKKYSIEMVASALLTLTVLLTNNPVAASFLWAALLFIRESRHQHGYYNLAVTWALYGAKILRFKETVFLSMAQIIGAVISLFCFKLISGAYFEPDAATLGSLPLLGCIEGIAAVVLCLVALTSYNNIKNGQYAPIYILFLSTTLLAVQSIGAIANASFGCAVLIGSLFNLTAPSLFAQFFANLNFSFTYCVIPAAAGLCTYQIKKWIDESI